MLAFISFICVFMAVFTSSPTEAFYLRGNNSGNGSAPVNRCQYTVCAAGSRCVTRRFPCLVAPCQSFAVCVQVRPGFCPLASPWHQNPWSSPGATQQYPWSPPVAIQQYPWSPPGAVPQYLRSPTVAVPPNPWSPIGSSSRNPWFHTGVSGSNPQLNQISSYQQNPWARPGLPQQNSWFQTNPYQQQNPWLRTTPQNPWFQPGVVQRNPWYQPSPFCVDQCSIDENCPPEQKCCLSGYCNRCVNSVATPWSTVAAGSTSAQVAEEAEEAAEG